MTEVDDLFEQMLGRLDRMDEALREIAERIAQLGRPPDVPLHQRGFGVMDEDCDRRGTQ